MCGLAGVVDPHRRLADPRATLAAMAERLRHRGPDGHAIAFDGEARVGLAHARLAIMDPSDAGAQPMRSACGRWSIAFNGEVYLTIVPGDGPERFARDPLVRELVGLGAPLRTGCDTEVVLEACARLGVTRAVERLRGMFAFALVDHAERRVHLVRDRIGIKPLACGTLDGVVVFASDLRALRVPGLAEPTIDDDARRAYFAEGVIGRGRTVWREIACVAPGTMTTIDARTGAMRSTRWWTPPVFGTVPDEIETPSPIPTDDDVHRSLAESVRSRLVADRPLGLFLSGGIDSSLVAALAVHARKASGAAEPLRTFTVGFDDAGFDEATHAAAVARELDTQHAELRLASHELGTLFDDWLAVHDEPFADASSLAMFAVSRLAREHVAVALSGDGGDEGFAGYNRHRFAHEVLDRFAATPEWLRGPAQALARGAASLAGLVPSSVLDAVLPASAATLRPQEKLHKIAEALRADGPAAFVRRVRAAWPTEGHAPMHVGPELAASLRSLAPTSNSSALEAVLAEDLAHYLPDDILAKVDRASMAVGLEVRVPLLDHDLLALARRLPAESLFDAHGGKAVLRRLLARELPHASAAGTFTRAKTGFAIPLASWMRGAWRDRIEALLTADRLESAGLDPAPVRAAWNEVLSERDAVGTRAWTAVCFVAWHARRT